MTSSLSQNAHRVYRVDKFKVPSSARNEFLERVRMTHGLLQTLPGFIQDFIREQTDGRGTFNCVTVVIWEDVQALDAAKMVMMEKHKVMGFDPKEMFDRLGIETDLANYAEVRA